MLTAHKIALDPNNIQATYLARAAGTARFAYNWALAEWQRQYEAHTADERSPKPSEAALRRKLNSIKREQFPWMLEVTKNAPQMAIMQLGTAFRNFFMKRAQYPQFRRKGIHDRFTLTNDQFSIEGSRIRIPGLGWVKMREPLRFDGKIMNATVSRNADRWFAAIGVDMPGETPYPPEGSPIALDVGLTTFAADSGGGKLEAPKPMAKNLLRLRRLQRRCARKVEEQKKKMGLGGKAIPKGVRLPVSSNLKKARQEVAKLHRRIGDIRKDFLHKTSTKLAKTKPVIVVEDLHVKGMVRNSKLARHIADVSWGEFRRQLAYKCRKFRSALVVTPRFLASSKLCSCCEHQLESLALSVRDWTCPVCGAHHDRDVNAAKNLLNWYIKHGDIYFAA